jgi:hypothetical protein
MRTATDWVATAALMMMTGLASCGSDTPTGSPRRAIDAGQSAPFFRDGSPTIAMTTPDSGAVGAAVLDQAEIVRRIDAAFAVYEELARAAAMPGVDCATTAAAIGKVIDDGGRALEARRAIDVNRHDGELADAVVAQRREGFAAVIRAIEGAAKRCQGEEVMQLVLDRLD